MPLYRRKRIKVGPNAYLNYGKNGVTSVTNRYVGHTTNHSSNGKGSTYTKRESNGYFWQTKTKPLKPKQAKASSNTKRHKRGGGLLFPLIGKAVPASSAARARKCTRSATSLDLLETEVDYDQSSSGLHLNTNVSINHREFWSQLIFTVFDGALVAMLIVGVLYTAAYYAERLRF